jgi:aminopeptidase
MPGSHNVRVRMEEATLAKYADLIVAVGANVQPDQVVCVSGEPGKEYLARAIAESAYRRGARYVDVSWFDPWVKRVRLEHAADRTLDYVPPWLGERVLALGRMRCARINLSGPVAPGLLNDIARSRQARDRQPALPEVARVTAERTTNWTVAPCPTVGWGQAIWPTLPAAEALARLDELVAHVCRLDHDDPARVWTERIDRLSQTAAELTDWRIRKLRFTGPGTELTVGLLPSTRWIAGRGATADGIAHVPNIPTEEVFTTPDPASVEGTVAATRPVVLPDGTVVSGLRLRFERGRAVEIDANSGADAMRAVAAVDDGACRLGEVALVDAEGRVASAETLFFDTLLDENAGSHLALGLGISIAVGDQRDLAQVNQSSIHVDVTVGSPEVDVTAALSDGGELALVQAGHILMSGSAP